MHDTATLAVHWHCIASLAACKTGVRRNGSQGTNVEPRGERWEEEERGGRAAAFRIHIINPDPALIAVRIALCFASWNDC